MDKKRKQSDLQRDTDLPIEADFRKAEGLECVLINPDLNGWQLLHFVDQHSKRIAYSMLLTKREKGKKIELAQLQVWCEGLNLPVPLQVVSCSGDRLGLLYPPLKTIGAYLANCNYETSGPTFPRILKGVLERILCLQVEGEPWLIHPDRIVVLGGSMGSLLQVGGLSTHPSSFNSDFCFGQLQDLKKALEGLFKQARKDLPFGLERLFDCFDKADSEAKLWRLLASPYFLDDSRKAAQFILKMSRAMGCCESYQDRLAQIRYNWRNEVVNSRCAELMAVYYGHNYKFDHYAEFLSFLRNVLEHGSMQRQYLKTLEDLMKSHIQAGGNRTLTIEDIKTLLSISKTSKKSDQLMLQTLKIQGLSFLNKLLSIVNDEIKLDPIPVLDNPQKILEFIEAGRPNFLYELFLLCFEINETRIAGLDPLR